MNEFNVAMIANEFCGERNSTLIYLPDLKKIKHYFKIKTSDAEPNPISPKDHETTKEVVR